MGFLTNLFRNKSRDEEFLMLCSSGSVEEVKQALSSWGFANAKDKNSNTALMYAAEMNKDKAVLRILIDAGANVHAKNSEGYTVLHFAAVNPNTTEIINFLLEIGIDVNVFGGNLSWGCGYIGVTPLIYASGLKIDNSRNIKMLINAGAHVNSEYIYINKEKHKQTTQVNTALTTAIINNTENVKALIESGADVNQKVYRKIEIYNPYIEEYEALIKVYCYPLMYASVHGNREILNLLLDAGADINARDYRGLTALGYANGFVEGMQRNEEAIKILELRGATL